MALKTCIQKKYVIYDFQSIMYPQRNQQNVSFEISTKYLQSNEHESKSIPDGKATKPITQADTLQTKILTLQEDHCRNQRILIWERLKQNNKGETKRSCYDNLKLIRNPYPTKLFFTAYPKQEK